MSESTNPDAVFPRRIPVGDATAANQLDGVFDEGGKELPIKMSCPRPAGASPATTNLTPHLERTP